MRNFNTKKNYCFLLSLFFSISLFAQDIALNEVMSSNLNTILDEDGTAQDWVELHNYGSVPVNLNGYGLSDDPILPFKWTLPNVTMEPNSFLIIWASDKDRTIVGQPLHTNFKITSNGEQIILTDPAGTLINESPATALPEDVSLGRQPDGTGSWLYFYQPTPNASNSTLGTAELIIPPAFSQNSGFFTEPFDLTISHRNPDALIVYTLDGSEPDINNLNGTTFEYKNVYPYDVGSSPGPLLSESFTSFQYSNPITIFDRSAQPDQLTTKNSMQDEIYIPPTAVRKGTVLKVKSYVNGIPSSTVSRSYFVWAGGNPYDLPVISLQTQENNLFDYDLGTYTAGVDFDTWRAENPDNAQSFRADFGNFARRGRDWEYPVHVEIFDNSVSVLNQRAGYRIHGNNSRDFIIKSLSLFARSEYDEIDTFEHDLFDVPIYDAPKASNNDFKRILLRANGSGGSVAYNVFFNRLMQPVYNGVNRVQPAIHFINGEYWGLTTIQDRMDEHHYANNFDLDKDNVAIIDCEGSNCGLDEGVSEDLSDYIDLRDYIIDNDMANDIFYTQAINRLDIVSFIDHMVLQIYSSTNGYEHSFWKARIAENEGYGDGKWRTSVKDFEPALTSNRDWLVHWATITGSPNEAILTNLLANSNFKTQFINRFADLLNSSFVTDHFLSIVNLTFDEVSPYLAENSNRTPATDFYTPSNRQKLINWGNSHPDVQRTSINTHFGISETVDLVLDLSNEEAGIIKVNTIDVTDTTPGITANPYPWTGIYFKNIPVTLTAKAKEGYLFSHWSGDVSSTNVEISLTPDTNKQIQANFIVDPNSLDVAYFWFMNTDIPNDTPLERLSSTYSSTSNSGSLEFDSSLTGYPFTDTDPKWRTASMERRNLPTPLNYSASANNNLPYDSGTMRGIQIKQPFRDGNLENTLRIVFPIAKLNQLNLSFAVESDGAASSLIMDYWNGSNWVTTGMSNPTAAIGEGYSIVERDLSEVVLANNQQEFQFRIRFDGENLFASEGKRVHINNIAVKGRQTLSLPNITKGLEFTAYPNPASTLVNMKSNESIEQLELYNLYGQMVRELKPNATSFSMDIYDLPQGIYLLSAKSDSQKTKVLKIIKK